MGGRDQPERPVAINRNRWSQSAGTRRIEFRVGIHLGDVVEESDGDLMGDGVNIAARLEGIPDADNYPISILLLGGPGWVGRRGSRCLSTSLLE